MRLSFFLVTLAVVPACSRVDLADEYRSRRVAYTRQVYDKEGALGSWELSPQNPDVRLGREWGPAEFTGDAQKRLRQYRWMGRWGTLMLRVDGDAPRTLKLTGVAVRALPPRIVTLRAGNDVLERFSPQSESDTFEHAFTFSPELIRKYREHGWVHITLEVPTSDDPAARGYKAYGLALKGIEWGTATAN